jgi:periplasmic protein TonB
VSSGVRDELFAGLGSASRRGGFRFGGSASIGAHAAIVVAIVLLPLLRADEPPPEVHEPVRVAFYNPAPPPPPPPPAASLSAVTKPKEMSVPVPVPDPHALVIPDEAESVPEAAVEAGAEVASVEKGVAGGVEDGIVGGTPGGVPGGTPDGVPGGTGDDPVLDVDRGPKLLKQSRPQYPDEAFVKKIEGTVVIEILIDVAGRVARTRVIRSFPMLDTAAIETVRQWIFAPAIKNGRPVPTLAVAPVTFTIH